jgi:hypothetical protein
MNSVMKGIVVHIPLPVGKCPEGQLTRMLKLWMQSGEGEMQL